MNTYTLTVRLANDAYTDVALVLHSYQLQVESEEAIEWGMSVSTYTLTCKPYQLSQVHNLLGDEDGIHEYRIVEQEN